MERYHVDQGARLQGVDGVAVIDSENQSEIVKFWPGQQVVRPCPTCHQPTNSWEASPGSIVEAFRLAHELNTKIVKNEAGQ